MLFLGVTERIAILLLLSLVSSVYSPQVHATPVPLSLDGVGTNTTCQTPTCVAQVLTTTKGQDVVILAVECGLGYCPFTISAILDSSGLSFAQHISYSTLDNVSEYYARATSPLKSDNITVVFSGGVSASHAIQVIAISGANTRAIFDRDPSIPATCTLSTCGDCSANFYLNPGTCSVSIQTSTIDFVLAYTAIADAPGCGGYPDSPAGYVPPPGFTNIAYPGKNTGASIFEVDYMITSSPKSNVTFVCNGTDAEVIVLDAISFRGAFGN
jgi:hypothetical protein